MKKKILFFLIIASFSLFGMLFMAPKQASAILTYSSGYYTKLCGDDANYGNGSGEGSINGVNGPYNKNGQCYSTCNTSTGTCTTPNSQNDVVMYWCDGKQTNCVEHESSWSTTQSFGNACGKTYQIDVFDHNCRGGGDWTSPWTCGTPGGFMVWYSGDCPVITNQTPTCNSSQIALNVSPNPGNTNGSVKLNITGDASTYPADNYGAGIGTCSGSWDSKSCNTTSNTGTFTWTHSWQHCVGSFTNCSPQCSASTTYTINAPTPSYTPPTATLSASPNPCIIQPGNTTCTSTISWSVTNAPWYVIYWGDSPNSRNSDTVFYQNLSQLSGSSTAAINSSSKTFSLYCGTNSAFYICATTVVTSVAAPAPTPPTIQSLQVNNSIDTQTNGFTGTSRVSGNTSGNNAGKNWLNPMNIKLSVNKGTNAINDYYTSFYTAAQPSQANFISQVTNSINSSPANGFMLHYNRVAGPNGTFEVWNPNKNGCGNSGWSPVTTLLDITDCSNNIYYRITPQATLTDTLATPNVVTWQVRFQPRFGNKTLSTGVYVIDSSGALSAYDSNYPTSP